MKKLINKLLQRWGYIKTADCILLCESAYWAGKAPDAMVKVFVVGVTHPMSFEPLYEDWVAEHGVYDPHEMANLLQKANDYYQAEIQADATYKRETYLT